jgi:hypothetical protein
LRVQELILRFAGQTDKDQDKTKVKTGPGVRDLLAASIQAFGLLRDPSLSLYNFSLLFLKAMAAVELSLR